MKLEVGQIWRDLDPRRKVPLRVRVLQWDKTHADCVNVETGHITHLQLADDGGLKRYKLESTNGPEVLTLEQRVGRLERFCNLVDE